MTGPKMRLLLAALTLFGATGPALSQPVMTRAGGIGAPGANPTWSIDASTGTGHFSALTGAADAETVGGVPLPTAIANAGGSVALSMGAVTGLPAGSLPAATVTKVGSGYQIALSIPAGATGSPGATPTIAAGNITAGAAGSDPVATLRSTGTNAYALDLTLPVGASGAPGATPTIAAGNVTAGAAGTSPVATLRSTGTNAYALDLTIPAGTTGSPGAAGAAGNSITAGSAVPTASSGQNGDRFMLTPTGELYVKTAGAWADAGYPLLTPPGIGAVAAAGGDASSTVVCPKGETTSQSAPCLTAQQRASWVYDLADHGARGDAASDTATFLKAQAFAAQYPGTTIFWPAGTWPMTSPGADGYEPVSNTTYAGASEFGAIITWNDTQSDTPNAAAVLFGAGGQPVATNVTFRDLSVQGSADTINSATGKPWLEAANGGYPFRIQGVSGLHFSRVAVTHSRIMSIRAAYSDNVTVQDSYVAYSQRDGISLDGVANYSIVGDVVEHGGDDAIAVHSAAGDSMIAGSATTSARRDGVIAANRLFDVGGCISGSSMRSVTVTANICDRFFLHGIAVGTTAGGTNGTEGYAAPLDILVDGNILTNGLDRSQVETTAPAGSYIAGGLDYIQITGQSARAGGYTGIPGLPGTDGVIHQPYFEVNANSSAASVATNPAMTVTVSNNILGRVIPPADGTDSRYKTWADLTMGALFEDNVAQGATSLTPAVSLGAMQGNGVHVYGGAIQGLSIVNNQFNGLYWALSLGSGTDYGTIQFRGNTITDMGQSAVYLQGGLGTTKGRLVMDDNLFDLDPYQIGYGRSTHGTWSNSAGPQIIMDNGTTPTNFGVTMVRNTLRNAGSVSNESTATPPAGWDERDNTAEEQPAAIGFSSSNKGIAVTPQGGWTVHVVDSDPTSSTYGQLLQAYTGTTTGMPTSGTYVQGDYLRDTTVGGQYAGWMRQTTGSGNTLGTDWVGVPNTAYVAAATAPILYNGQIGSSCDTATVGHQTCSFRLQAATSSTANTRLTADGNAASTTNSVCLPAGVNAMATIDFLGTDKSSGANAAYVSGWRGILSRTGAASTMAVNNVASPATSSLYPSIGADTTNGCVNINITPANADSTSWTANLKLTFAQ